MTTKGHQDIPYAKLIRKNAPASTPNIIENDDDSDDNGDNNYDDDYDDDDYDDAFGHGVFRSSIVCCSISFSLIMVRPRGIDHGLHPP